MQIDEFQFLLVRLLGGLHFLYMIQVIYFNSFWFDYQPSLLMSTMRFCYFNSFWFDYQVRKFLNSDAFKFISIPFGSIIRKSCSNVQCCISNFNSFWFDYQKIWNQYLPSVAYFNSFWFDYQQARPASSFVCSLFQFLLVRLLVPCYILENY